MKHKPWYKQKGTWGGLIIILTALGKIVTGEQALGIESIQPILDGLLALGGGLGFIGVRRALG